jgi:hypothetical protein
MMTKDVICLILLAVSINAKGFYSKFHPLAEEII